jgi:hypothetical protein
MESSRVSLKRDLDNLDLRTRSHLNKEEETRTQLQSLPFWPGG